MGERDGKILYKKEHMRGLTGTKSKDVTSEKRTQFKKQGTNFEGNLRKEMEAQKFFSRKCLGRAQLKLCSCGEAATRAPSCLLMLPWSFPQKINRGRSRKSHFCQGHRV